MNVLHLCIFLNRTNVKNLLYKNSNQLNIQQVLSFKLYAFLLIFPLLFFIILH